MVSCYLDRIASSSSVLSCVNYWFSFLPYDKTWTAFFSKYRCSKLYYTVFDFLKFLPQIWKIISGAHWKGFFGENDYNDLIS